MSPTSAERRDAHWVSCTAQVAKSKELHQERRGEVWVGGTAKDYSTTIGKRLGEGGETRGSYTTSQCISLDTRSPRPNPLTEEKPESPSSSLAKVISRLEESPD